MLIVFMDGGELEGRYADEYSDTGTFGLTNVMLPSGIPAEVVLVPRTGVCYVVTTKKELTGQ